MSGTDDLLVDPLAPYGAWRWKHLACGSTWSSSLWVEEDACADGEAHVAQCEMTNAKTTTDQDRSIPDSWEGDTAAWSIADASVTVLLHGASTVGREIDLDILDGVATLTDDQALRVADALRSAATWPNLQAAHDALVADLGASLDLEAGLRDINGPDPEDR